MLIKKKKRDLFEREEGYFYTFRLKRIYRLYFVRFSPNARNLTIFRTHGLVAASSIPLFASCTSFSIFQLSMSKFS
jgi:hypothetical protein